MTKKLDRVARMAPTKVMFPAHHDITPWTFSACYQALQTLLKAGHEVLIVSKPHFGLIAELCQEFVQYREQILFRFTIGSADNDVLNFWEPGAPSFRQRRKALQYAYDHHYETSISCEPILDQHPERMYEKLAPFVTDAVWFGLPNFLEQRLESNGFTDRTEMNEAQKLLAYWDYNRVMQLYTQYKDDPHVKWKESIKKIVGIEVPTEAGLDV
jgi:DNA repair photolyase